MIGAEHRGALVTAVDRMSTFVVLLALPRKTKEPVGNALASMLGIDPAKVQAAPDLLNGLLRHPCRMSFELRRPLAQLQPLLQFPAMKFRPCQQLSIRIPCTSRWNRPLNSSTFGPFYVWSFHPIHERKVVYFIA